MYCVDDFLRKYSNVLYTVGHSDSLGERGVGSLRRERMTNLYIPKSASATDNYPTDFFIVKDRILN